MLRSRDSGETFESLASAPVTVDANPGAPIQRLGDYKPHNAQLAGTAVIAYSSEAILASDDKGASWKRIPAPLPDKPIASVSFVSSTTGYAVSAKRLFLTSDGGRAWTETRSLGHPCVDAPGRLSFSSALDGYVLPPSSPRSTDNARAPT